MKRHGTPERAAIVTGAVAAAAATLLMLGPSRFGAGITTEEVRWLHDARGLGPRLVDAWAGMTTSDGILRAPFWIAAALAVLVAALAAARVLTPLAAFAAAVAFGAEIALVGGGPRAGSVAPLAAVTAAACLAVVASGSRRRWIALAAVAGAMGILEPGLCAFPLGAAAGALIPARRREGRSPSAVAVACALVACVLVLAFAHLGLEWHAGDGRTARTIQKLLLATSALAVLAAAMRPFRAASPGILLPVAGGLLASCVWLLLVPLRETTPSPLAVLLMTAPFAAAMALGSRSATAKSMSAPAPSPPSGASPGWLRLSGPTLVAVLMAALSLAAFAKRRPLPLDVLPLADALDAMKSAAPDVRYLLAGQGLTTGVVARAGRRAGLAMEPGMKPGRAKLGVLSIASAIPSILERDALAARIGGDRVLDRYGLTGERTILRWTTLRPFDLTIADGGARPNIAIVSVDTLRADHLGVYGYARATSPSTDAWARGALVYERAMSAAPATAPSFSSLFTGRLPIAHGVRKNYEFLDPGNMTLARILAMAGYDTAAFVSSFVLTRENCGLDLGISHYDQAFEGREANREDRPLRLAPALAASVGAWIDARRTRGGDKPWFLWVHAIDPHGPYTPLPEFRGTFTGGETRAVERSLIPQYQWLGTTDYATYVNAYDDEILQTDRSLGALLTKIESIPSPRGTIIVFVADHGEAFGEHGFYFEHGQSLHAEEIHVPLIVKDTAHPRTGRVGAPVSLLDLLPTLLARLSIQTDLPFDGTTLEAREAPEGGPILLANWRPGQVMALRSPWKLIARSDGKERSGASGVTLTETRQYDVLADPAEARGAHPDAAALGELLRAATSLLLRDPLTAASGRALQKRQWEGLSPEAQEKLRALGYAGN